MRRALLLAARAAAVALAVAHAVPAGAADVAAKAPADPPPHPVLDPHYGDVLFEFYQGRYLPALTKVEVSQQFQRMPHHADEAEVLRGGLLLSYGMHRQAAAVFEQLIARGASPSVRDRAWYYLAKVRWQRGLPAEAADALARIEHPLPAPLQEDRELLQASAWMALGDNAAAARLLAPAQAARGGSLYARYNLGVALVRAGDAAQGAALLDAIGRMHAPDEEQRALRDKANVALGFAALRDARPREARGYLERVRLDGLQSNQALLGFGWAADALKDPRLALVPWLELAGRDPSDAAVLEAQLAVPYAFAELGASGQALERYTVAIDNFAHESANIDATVEAIRQGRLRAGLLARNPDDRTGWFRTMRDVPLLPHARHLLPVIAGHAFQEAFKNYRDLLGLQVDLGRWHDDVAVYADMVDTRVQRYAEHLPDVRTRAQALDVTALADRTASDAAALKSAEEARDGAAFADARERALQARLDRARGALQRMDAADAADPALASARERLRRVAGALQWEIARAYSERDWDARKHQAQTEATLDAARAHATALAAAERDAPARFAEFAQRLQALSARLDALAPRVRALAQSQAQALDDLAVASLQAQKAQLADYTAQAKIAVAQIYDRAAQAGEGADAKHP